MCYPPRNPKTLLITRFSALGDVAMTIPAVYSAAKQHPDTHFIYATKPFFCRIFINKPENLEVVPIDLNQYKGFFGIFKLIRRMYQFHPDAVADMHNVLRTWLIGFSFRIKGNVQVRMLDKQRKNRSQKQIKNQVRPFVLRYFDVLTELGLYAKPQFQSVFEGPNAAISLPAILPTKGEKHWIGLAPFARYLNKAYPYDMGAQLVEQLNSLPNTQLFLFGGGETERASLEAWTKQVSGPIIMVGKMSIEEEIAFMSQLDVMISMDSANMHLASIAGTRVVSLWGSTAPSCGFLGWNQLASDAICLDLPCQPCTVAGSNKCKFGHFNCLKEMKPELIVNKVKEIIIG